MKTVVKLESVSFRRGDHHILQNINWEIRQGEHWALIGLNGSGKTSLLNIIGGYLWPSTGNVEVMGNRFGKCDIREVRKAIGSVSAAVQEQLHPGDPCVEVVITGKYAALTLYEATPAEDVQQATHWLESMEVSHLAEKPYAVLSQGEKQKVLIARAMMARPSLFILDEPCAGLDLYAREHLLKNVEKIADAPDAPTFIYVTHHIEEILPFITHALLLKDGRIIAKGPKHEVLSARRLQETFDLPVNVSWNQDRPWIRIVR